MAASSHELLFPWARATRHQTRSRSSSIGESYGIAILVALALFDTQGHSLTVDIPHPQCHDLADAQSCTIGHGECGLMFPVAGGGNQAGDFFPAQHHWQGAGKMYRLP